MNGTKPRPDDKSGTKPTVQPTGQPDDDDDDEMRDKPKVFGNKRVCAKKIPCLDCHNGRCDEMSSPLCFEEPRSHSKMPQNQICGSEDDLRKKLNNTMNGYGGGYGGGSHGGKN